MIQFQREQRPALRARPPLRLVADTRRDARTAGSLALPAHAARHRRGRFALPAACSAMMRFATRFGRLRRAFSTIAPGTSGILFCCGNHPRLFRPVPCHNDPPGRQTKDLGRSRGRLDDQPAAPDKATLTGCSQASARSSTPFPECLDLFGRRRIAAALIDSAAPPTAFEPARMAPCVAKRSEPLACSETSSRATGSGRIRYAASWSGPGVHRRLPRPCGRALRYS